MKPSTINMPRNIEWLYLDLDENIRKKLQNLAKFIQANANKDNFGTSNWIEDTQERLHENQLSPANARFIWKEKGVRMCPAGFAAVLFASDAALYGSSDEFPVFVSDVFFEGDFTEDDDIFQWMFGYWYGIDDTVNGAAKRIRCALDWGVPKIDNIGNVISKDSFKIYKKYP